MVTQPHDKEVFRDSAFNRLNNIPSLSNKMQRPDNTQSKSTREQEIFSRLPSIPIILENDKKKDTIRMSPPFLLNRDVEYQSEGSSHKLIRSSMYTVPADEDLFELVGLPFFTVFQPFNHAVAVPEYRTSYLPKCKDCNSFPTQEEALFQFKFKCAMCGMANEINTDCPSLHEHTTEYICENECLNERSWYSSNSLLKSDIIALPSCREWAEPCLIFVIDCSVASKSNTGYVEYISGVKSILLSSEISLFYRRFAVLLVNENVSVISDSELGYSVNIIYSVKGDYGLCAPLFIETESLTEERVNSLLGTIESIPAGQFNSAGAITAAIQMTAYTGGSKVVAWLGGLEYSEVSDDLVRTAVDCGLSLNVFTTKSSKLDKLHKIIFSTGGSVEREFIPTDVIGKVVQESFFRCSIRILCSDGVKKRAVYSSGSSENISMLSFPEMTSSTTFAISFSVEDFLKEGAPIYIQSIIEYINLAGENRVRVINMKLKASRLIQQIFLGLSLDTLFCGMCKYIYSEPLNIVENIRKAENSMISALSLYKKACAKDTSSTQLVLPDSIKGLPVLIQSILKYPKVHLGPSIKIELAGEVMPLSVDRTFRLFYPRLIKISSLFTVAGIDDLVGERLSMRELNTDESYLLDTGCKTILWFGKGAVDYMDEMVQNEVVVAALERLKEVYEVELKITNCIQGEMDAEFIGYMIEDQMGGYAKYQEYLGFLHGKIVKK